MLWRCWLGGRKGIRPVKNRVVGCWCGCLSGARCRLAYGPADATATHLSLASVKSRLVLPFWYWLTWVVPEKGPLNGCVCVCVCCYVIWKRWQYSLVQEAQLSRSDHTMRLVSSNLANYHATVQKLLIRQVLTKPMVWSWRFSRRQCVINNVHSTMTRPSRTHCLTGVINKPTTVE